MAFQEQPMSLQISILKSYTIQSWIVIWGWAQYWGHLRKSKLMKQTIYFQESPCDIGDIGVS